MGVPVAMLKLMGCECPDVEHLDELSADGHRRDPRGADQDRSRDQAALQGQGLLPVLPHRSEL